jgi:uncharacterized protein (DUF2062 family)
MAFSIKKHKDRLVFKLKRHFVEVLKSKKSEKSIAMGFAIGSFVALFPTPGFSTLIGLGVIAIFKRVNKLAVLLALALYNGVTVLPFYWASLEVGEFIFSKASTVTFEIEFFNEVYQYTRRFVVGNLMITMPYAYLSYYFALWVTRKIRANRKYNA